VAAACDKDMNLSFHLMLGNSRVDQRVVASQEGLSSTKLLLILLLLLLLMMLRLLNKHVSKQRTEPN
jgi:hypothetical protein